MENSSGKVTKFFQGDQSYPLLNFYLTKNLLKEVSPNNAISKVEHYFEIFGTSLRVFLALWKVTLHITLPN